MQSLDQMTNEEIVLLLKESFDEEGFEFLARRFHNLLYKLFERYDIYSFDWDDYCQEFQIILYRSVQKYQMCKKFYFASYLNRMLNNHFINLTRINKAQKRIGSSKVLYLQARMGRREDGLQMIDVIYDETAPTSHEVAEVREKNHTYFCSLSKAEKLVFKLYLEGHTMQEISEKTELNIKQTRSALTRCQHKMRQLYND